MRFIKTKNGHVQFVETTDFGDITASIGYPFNEVAYKITKNGCVYKVVFYEKNSDKPFTKEIWYSNLPINIDDVVYSDAEAAAEALGGLMDGELAQRIDALDEKIDGVDDKVDDVKDSLHELDVKVIGVDDKIDDEIVRATEKDALHDSQIFNNYNSINSEIERATNAENAIISDLNDEVSRATEAENEIKNDLDAEIDRSEAKDAEQDGRLSLIEDGLEHNDFFKVVEYDSDEKLINFKNNDGDIVGSVDTTDFVKDGMIDSVEIVDDNLVITFNTDSGKEPITIALSEIFNPSDYYTKTDIDEALDLKANVADVYNKNDIDGRFENYYNKADVDGGLSIKANKDTVYTKEETDDKLDLKADKAEVEEALDTKANVSDVYNKEEIYYALAGKADKTEIYDKSEINDLLEDKADADSVYNKTEVDEVLDDKADKSDTYTKSEVDSALDDKADASSVYTKTEINEKFEDYYTKDETDEAIEDAIHEAGGVTPTTVQNMIDASIVTKADVSTLNAHTSNNDIHVTATDKANWNAKSDFDGDYNSLTNKPQIPDVSNYYTKAEVDAELNDKQDTLVSGSNIKTINNISLLGSGNIDIQGGGGSSVQSDWNQTDSTADDYIKNKPTIPDVSDYYTKNEVDAALNDKADVTDLTAHTSNADIHVTAQDKQNWNNKSDFDGNYNSLTNKPTLSTVATSGSYNDLSNKPTIPTIWSGTQAQYDAITVKDPATLYLIY